MTYCDNCSTPKNMARTFELCHNTTCSRAHSCRKIMLCHVFCGRRRLIRYFWLKSWQSRRITFYYIKYHWITTQFQEKKTWTVSPHASYPLSLDPRKIPSSGSVSPSEVVALLQRHLAIWLPPTPGAPGRGKSCKRDVICVYTYIYISYGDCRKPTKTLSLGLRRFPSWTMDFFWFRTLISTGNVAGKSPIYGPTSQWDPVGSSAASRSSVLRSRTAAARTIRCWPQRHGTLDIMEISIVYSY